VIGAVVAEAEAETGEPTEAELRRFYAAESDRFRRPGSVRVEQIFFAAAPEAEAAARRRAETGHRRLLGGESFTTVRAAGDPEPIPLPAGPLPPAKLLDYLGPTVTRATLALAAGGVSPPVRSGWGYHLVRLIAREPAAVPPFEAVRQEVWAEFRRQAGERRLRRYLDELRAAADIAKVEALP
jgi:parvulin-like peptidyl-prolyl isomerase